MFFWIIYEFSFVFCWISGKMDQKKKILAIVGISSPLKRPLGIAKDPHAVARPRGKVGPASGSPR